jgi:peptidoglycan/LPS O-acetylase OafA/YrhL
MPQIMQADSATLAAPAGVQTQVAPSREFYIDRLRAVMTAMVILHHTAITYGAPGGWFWYELKPSGSITGLLLLLFVATNQAYFMGFFFLLAGYFTPASLDRKGYGSFIGDRFMRLGLPLLGFIFVLGPLTAAMAHAFDNHGEFWPVFPYLWNHAIIINGPLWFAQALLLFSLGYCAWHRIAGPRVGPPERVATPVPGYAAWLMGAIAVGAAAVLIRQIVPVGKNIIGLQLGYFASYVFLFAVGIVAWRHDWLRRLNITHVGPWLVTLAIAWPMLLVTILVANHVNGPGKSHFDTGFSWTALTYAVWEPFVAWGLIAGLLLLFRKYINKASKLWEWLGRRAYAVYVIHPPVLVGVAMLAHRWHAPALVKFGVIGAIAMAACWIVSDPLVRLPGLKRVL